MRVIPFTFTYTDEWNGRMFVLCKHFRFISGFCMCVCVICAHMHNVTCHRCTDCQCVQEWLAIDKENVDGQLPEIRSLFMNLATQK